MIRFFTKKKDVIAEQEALNVGGLGSDSPSA